MNIRPKILKSLLKDLVDIYSPSGKEEEIVEFTERYLKKHGLAVRKQEVDENRFNLIVFPPRRDGVELLIPSLPMTLRISVPARKTTPYLAWAPRI
jgi:acetylornithine deacetylase